MSSYNHENNFLIFGGGIVLVAIMGLFIGTTSLTDVVAAVIAAYIILRIVNAMAAADRRGR